MAKTIRNYPPEILWIKKSEDFISLRAIEQHLKLPAKCLTYYCRGFYGIKEEYWPRIVAWVREFAKIGPASMPEPVAAPKKAPVIKEAPPVKSQKSASNSYLESRRQKKGIK